MQHLTKTRSLFQSTMLTRSQIANFSTATLKALNDPSKRQFYVEMNGELAIIDYAIDGKNITFIHTEVPEIFRGKGVGKILAEEAFSYAVKENLTVQVNCDYLQHYIDTNRDKYKNIKLK